jgi:carbon monoxide dehydrogenase subunit G
MKVQKSIDIAVSPDKIWPFFVEPEKVMQWCITFRKYEYTNKQYYGVGTPIYIEEQAGGPLMKMNFKITDCIENEKLDLQMVSGSGVKAYKQCWSLEPVPSGSRFTFKEEIELPFGIVGKLLGNVMEGSSARTVDRMLATLKALAEV